MIFIPKRKDLIGMAFGDFKVVEMLYGYKTTNNKPRTYCKCVGIDGNEYIIRADALTSGATKHIDNVGKKNVAIDITNQRFGKLVAKHPTNLRGANGGVIWYCECDCGNHIHVQISNLKRGHTMSCGCKKTSKYVDLIIKQLQLNNIEYELEYRFKDCKNKKGTDTLPFDIYIKSLNLAIEYDGEHHFMPINGWGGNEKFKRVIENDLIKNDYCKENGIKLLRIPYTYSNTELINSVNDVIRPATTTVA